VIEAAWFLAGLAAGSGLVFFLQSSRSKRSSEAAAQMLAQSAAQSKAQTDELVRNLEARFGELSLKALSQSTGEFLKLAGTQLKGERETDARELDGKKALIDQRLTQMNAELEKVSRIIQTLEKDREEKFGQLVNQLKNHGEQTALLQQTTQTLKEALASSKSRGQWGERMAEDVLRLAGFVENLNYLKQKSIAGVGSTPDITFLLPKNLRLNMDVKFPYDNYVRYLEASVETERERFRGDFLRDVKAKVKEVTTRDYINPEQNTLDYVLLFVPNEQIYAFIHEQDPELMDAGIRKRVVFCSPITLFAVLAVIRQAVDNFSLEQTSNEILTLLSKFKKQWGLFLDKMDNVGKKIDAAQKEFLDLSGTRRNQLERPLNRIDEIRRQKGLAGDDGDAAAEPPALDAETSSNPV
jgi:DNA recombination protein RmuC